MGYRQYIGARYVPKYEGTWDATKNYEPLTIVDDANGNSYTSKKDVPAGTQLIDREYWIQTSSFSGAITQLQNRVNDLEGGALEMQGEIEDINERMQGEIEDINERMNSLFVTPEMYGAVGDGITDDNAALQEAINTGKTVLGFNDYYSSRPITINNHEQKIALYGKVIFTGTGFILSNATRIDLYVKLLVGSGSGYGIYLHKYNEDGGRRVITFCRFSGIEISNFEKGIYCHVETDTGIGIQYNVFDFMRIYNTTVAIEYLVNGTSNWCTQNKFSNMRLEGCSIGVKLVSNSDVSNNNIFDNVGFESPAERCIVLQNVASSYFNDIRMAENYATSYYIDMQNCKDIHYTGDILLAPTKIRDAWTSTYSSGLDALLTNFYKCERIDSEIGGGFRASEMISNNGAFWYLDQFNAANQIFINETTHVLGVDAPSSDSMYYNLRATSGQTANLVIPFGLFSKIDHIWINVSHAGGTEKISTPAGAVLYDASNLTAGLYMFYRYGSTYRPVKAA